MFQQQVTWSKQSLTIRHKLSWWRWRWWRWCMCSAYLEEVVPNRSTDWSRLAGTTGSTRQLTASRLEASSSHLSLPPWVGRGQNETKARPIGRYVFRRYPGPPPPLPPPTQRTQNNRSENGAATAAEPRRDDRRPWAERRQGEAQSTVEKALLDKAFFKFNSFAFFFSTSPESFFRLACGLLWVSRWRIKNFWSLLSFQLILRLHENFIFVLRLWLLWLSFL